MKRARWATCDDPVKMLQALEGRRHATDRKLRLFAAAACRLRPALCRSKAARHRISCTELGADNRPLPRGHGDTGAELPVVHNLSDPDSIVCAQRVARKMGGRYGYPARVEMAALVREVFGDDPDTPFEFRPEWRSADALWVARVAYEDRVTNW